jgi:hypothetical protein
VNERQQGRKQQGGSTVREIKWEGHHEVMSDEWGIIMASKAIDIPHHTRRAMEDLKEIDESDG